MLYSWAGCGRDSDEVIDISSNNIGYTLALAGSSDRRSMNFVVFIVGLLLGALIAIHFYPESNALNLDEFYEAVDSGAIRLDAESN